MGMALGVAFGSVVGVLTDNIGLWIGVGIAIGAGVGNGMQAQNKNDDEPNDPDGSNE